MDCSHADVKNDYLKRDRIFNFNSRKRDIQSFVQEDYVPKTSLDNIVKDAQTELLNRLNKLEEKCADLLTANGLLIQRTKELETKLDVSKLYINQLEDNLETALGHTEESVPKDPKPKKKKQTPSS